MSQRGYLIKCSDSNVLMLRLFKVVSVLGVKTGNRAKADAFVSSREHTQETFPQPLGHSDPIFLPSVKHLSAAVTSSSTLQPRNF